MCREQYRLGYDAGIWCLDGDEDRRWAVQSSDLPDVNVKTFARSWPAMLGYSLSMEEAAIGPGGENVHIVHQHGIWTGVSRTTNILRQRYGIPTVVAPHGSLEGWAFNKSRWKKRLALALYERANLQKVSCLHACSNQEVSGFRDFGLNNPIAVIPNGVGNSWLKSEGSGSTFRKKFNIPESMKIFLYLSRITPIKGLPMLIEAIASIRQQFSDCVLVLAGADEFNHLKDVQKAINDFGIQNNVVLTGMLKDQVKRDAFAAADVFILPTHRENFAIVVAEALAAGVPVITTKGAPWQELVTYDCGWWTDISAGALAVALQDACARSPEVLKAMGERGRKLVSSHYTWKQAAEMTIELYEWLLGSRPRPEFVITG